ncbi:MAG: hypothetical protein ACI9R3_003250, partial [Verrucomicrobiales bacterium]
MNQTKNAPIWISSILITVILLGSTTVAEVVISELLASNATNLADEDGIFSDWVELHNDGDDAVDLAGWMLTDDANFDITDPESVWTIPSRELAAGGRLVVFASGKDRTDAAPAELHTKFLINSAGEFLALVRPDGTVASEFAPTYPAQRADISYGSGQASLGLTKFIADSADVSVIVPDDDSLADTWKGGTEPFDVAGWTAARGAVGFDNATGAEGFDFVEGFDSLEEGAIDGINGWSASDDGAAVTFDPANPENLVMVLAGVNVRVWKSIAIPDGDTATLFFRMRRSGEVNISAGSSDRATPGTNFADFETQVNNQNDGSLKVRDGGAFRDVDAFDEDVWYSIWMVIDNAADTYRVFLSGGIHSEPTLIDTDGGLTEFSFRNGDASNELVNFFARTGGASPGNWFIDDIYVGGGENLGDPVAGLSYSSFIDPTGDLKEAMSGAHSAAYLRFPFTIGDLPGLGSLSLNVRYDDGFVAYLNGEEIARRNAPAGTPAWNATATATRPSSEAIRFESIDVSGAIGALIANSQNILAIHALNVAADDADFLFSTEFSGAEAGAAGGLVYFAEPTPGKPNNDSGVLGFVEDTRFDMDRGFYSDPISVTITSASPGASIIYTTDGSDPTPDNGTIVPPLTADAAATAAVPITTTTTLRASAYREGFLPTNIDTHSYIFLADVIRQGNEPEGYPTTWKGDGGNGSFPADYEMDPEITEDPKYKDILDDALLAIPTISIVTDRDNLFDRATGIYQNPQRSGIQWERPASMEIIYPDRPADSAQIDCGIRIQGGHTREPAKNPKHSFRVNFKRIYGSGSFRHDLFPGDPDATRDFDQLILRNSGNQSWLHHNEFEGDNRGRAQYIRDQWAKDVQQKMGNPAARNIYAHLYLNGIYWGVTNPTERATAGFGQSYLGGRKEDIVALNSGAGVAGDDATREFRSLNSLARDLDDPARYQQLSEILDLSAFADYMILNHYGGNIDWDHHNWYGIRNMAGGKWYFIAWDSEFFFTRDNDNVVRKDNANNPSRILTELKANPDFRLLFADRIQKHLFNDGLLTPDVVVANWERRKDMMFDAIIGESARWGDYRRDVHQRGNPRPIPVYDRDEEWMAERTRLLEDYFPNRTETIINQYRAAGWFPEVDSPVFSANGGRVESGFQLEMTATTGDIIYTLDGSDPRVPTETVTEALIPDKAPLKVFVPTDESLGVTWRGGTDAFDDSTWIPGVGTAWFENNPGEFAEFGGIDLFDLMRNVTASCYVRMTFDIPDQDTLDRIGSLTLYVRYDDGFAAFINGEQIAESQAADALTWDARATASHSDAQAVLYEPFETGADALKVGTNILAIHAMNQSAVSSDFLIGARLDATSTLGSGVSADAKTYDGPILLNSSSIVRARTRSGLDWSPMTEATYLTGIAASADNLIVSEIMYNPAGPDDAEFIEVMNISGTAIDLSGVRFSSGVDFSFPIGSSLAPGSHTVIVRDRSAFEARYGGGLPVAGEFANGTALDNAGERIVIVA